MQPPHTFPVLLIHEKCVGGWAPGNVSGGCKCRCPPLGVAVSAPPNSLAGFEGPLRGGGRQGKGKEGKRREKRENTPQTRYHLYEWQLLMLETIWKWLRKTCAIQLNKKAEYVVIFPDHLTIIISTVVSLIVINRSYAPSVCPRFVGILARHQKHLIIIIIVEGGGGDAWEMTLLYCIRWLWTTN